MPAKCSTLFVAWAAVILWGCPGIPDSYAPPIQRKPVTGPERAAYGHFVNMGDSNSEAYLVRDINRNAEDGYRWTQKRPELRFALARAQNTKLVMDFAIPDVTMAQTGPVTISFYVNDRLLDTVRYDRPGTQHFEKPVPASWLRTDAPTLVAAEIDKLYVAPQDGAKLGFVISSAGFVE